ELLRQRRGGAGDLPLALFFYGGIALGAVLVGRVGTTVNLSAFLFGSVLTVTPADLAVVTAVGVLDLAAVAVFYRPLLSITYDEESALASGLPVAGLNLLLAGLTGLTVAAGMRVVGILLVSATLAVPAAASLAVARSFRGALLGAVAVGMTSAVTGLALAYAVDVAPGGAIVLTSLAMYAILTVVGRHRRLP
ncbi:MAG: metal ABC transporter permease, partial [Clostridia bacterium]|nr:metal ABC transporter permease [Clostridia bacterium]